MSKFYLFLLALGGLLGCLQALEVEKGEILELRGPKTDPYFSRHDPKPSLSRTINRYSLFDSRYALHGSRNNELNGGSCREFLHINANLTNACCASRNDDCFMIHRGSRCFCDEFCALNVEGNDCCPDKDLACGVVEISLDCATPDGRIIEEGDEFMDNCNYCRCMNGMIKCGNNDCLIDRELIDEINKSPVGWKAGNYSDLWGHTLQYGYLHKLGAKIPGKLQVALTPAPHPELENRTQYDFREEPFMKTEGNFSHIRDQGICAASWAFSTIDVVSDRAYKRGKPLKPYSVQMLIACAEAVQSGCQPNSIEYAWKFLEEQGAKGRGRKFVGVVDEECYPYRTFKERKRCEITRASSKNTSLLRCQANPARLVGQEEMLFSKPAYPVHVASEKDIMNEILNNGPVQAIMVVYNDFFLYKSGIYRKHKKAKKIGTNYYHAVKILGWGTENSVDYWIAANYWGEDWGEKGYFRIKRKDEDTEIEKHIYSSWV